MTKQQLIYKVTSRKFFALLCGLAVALLVLFQAPEQMITQVLTVITAIGSIVIYIWGEATVDAARVKAASTPENITNNQF